MAIEIPTNNGSISFGIGDSYISDLKRQAEDVRSERTKPKMPEKIRTALRVAARALDIADDHNVSEVQCHPPPEWNLPAISESAAGGWCSTYALAEKLREIADEK